MPIPSTSDAIAKLKANECPPASAFRVGSGICTLAEEGKPNESKSIKVTLKARQRGPINHWAWGTVWHDLSSYRTKGDRIAIDDSHGNEIGYGFPRLTEYGLEVNGVIVTNPDCPEHESNRIAYNLRNGIPQEASIDFTGDYDVLELPEGVKVPCNGLTAEGNCCIVQNWPLRAVAICKEGADPSTETVATALSADQKFGPLPKHITQFSYSVAPQPSVGRDEPPVRPLSVAPETQTTRTSEPLVPTKDNQETTTMSAEAKPIVAAPAAPATNLSTPAAAPGAATASVDVAPVKPVEPAPAAVEGKTDAEKQTAKPAEGGAVEGAKAPEAKPVEAKPAEQQTAPNETPKQPEKPKPDTELTAKLSRQEAEITQLKASLSEKDAEIAKLNSKIAALGAGAPPVPTQSSGPIKGDETLKWHELVEQVRKSMPADSTGPQVLAEAIRRHPEAANRARTPKQAK